ncbi:hypothetical protein [Pseudozobellia sp. WGM2]|uniref:hypothetical protein n=1 Tax=Pseudozobellia sp. WGM2 TaxID=2787625 RepID=UPI001AE0D93B|nr:hypothetical protein [Pseudozobellia sp. WGM2]
MAQLLDISGRYMQSGRQILFPIPQNHQRHVRSRGLAAKHAMALSGSQITIASLW